MHLIAENSLMKPRESVAGPAPGLRRHNRDMAVIIPSISSPRGAERRKIDGVRRARSRESSAVEVRIDVGIAVPWKMFPVLISLRPRAADVCRGETADELRFSPKERVLMIGFRGGVDVQKVRKPCGLQRAGFAPEHLTELKARSVEPVAPRAITGGKTVPPP